MIRVRRHRDEPSIHGEPMLVSPADWRRRSVRRTFGAMQWGLLILLGIVAVGPILLAGEVGGHADPGHADQADGVGPQRVGLEQPE